MADSERQQYLAPEVAEIVAQALGRTADDLETFGAKRSANFFRGISYGMGIMRLKKSFGEIPIPEVGMFHNNVLFGFPPNTEDWVVDVSRPGQSRKSDFYLGGLGSDRMFSNKLVLDPGEPGSY
jgi:hypothetical protein